MYWLQPILRNILRRKWRNGQGNNVKHKKVDLLWCYYSSKKKKSLKGKKVTPKKKKTEHKESTRCALCVGLFGSLNAKKTVYFCPTCGVYLCNKRRGNSKATCFSKWHTCAHLRSLAKKSTAKNPPSRKSPRREKARGSVVTEDGKRRSTRGKKWNDIQGGTQ